MARLLALNEDEETLERAFRTFRALYRLRELELNRLGLSVIEAGVLYFVKVSPQPPTPAQISRIVHRPPHTISVTLDRLEGRGLVKKSICPNSRNQVMVWLTRNGERILQRQLSEGASRNITSCVSREDLAVLNRVLKQLHDRAVQLMRQAKSTAFDDSRL